MPFWTQPVAPRKSSTTFDPSDPRSGLLRGLAACAGWPREEDVEMGEATRFLASGEAERDGWTLVFIDAISAQAFARKNADGSTTFRAIHPRTDKLLAPMRLKTGVRAYRVIELGWSAGRQEF